MMVASPQLFAGGDTSVADQKKLLGTSADAPACRQCGKITMRNGTEFVISARIVGLRRGVIRK